MQNRITERAVLYWLWNVAEVLVAYESLLPEDSPPSSLVDELDRRVQHNRGEAELSQEDHIALRHLRDEFHDFVYQSKMLAD